MAATARWVTSFLYQLRVLLERQGKQSRGEAFSGVNIFQASETTLFFYIHMYT
jgi:hypothetical protein